jgi:hypothetical protein
MLVGTTETAAAGKEDRVHRVQATNLARDLG